MDGFSNINLNIDYNMTSSMNSQFTKSEKKLKKLRKWKLVSKSDVNKVSQSKQQSLSSTTQGLQSAKQGQDSFEQSKPMMSFAQGAAGKALSFGAMNTAMTAIGLTSGNSVNIASFATMNMNINTDNVDQLYAMLGQSQTNQMNMFGALSQLSSNMSQQMNTGNMLQQSVQYFGQQESMFNMQAMQAKAKQTMLNGLSTGLTTASTALTGAATGIETASTAVQTASNAVAGIPFASI